MKDDLLKAKHASYKDKGLSTVGCKPVHQKTVKNYVQLAACFGRLVHAAPPKSMSRETAEHSLINAMSFALTVGGTSLIPVKTRHPAPPGNFAKVMRDRGWTDVGCVEAGLLTSSDDATFVCSEDVKEGSRPEWRVANVKG